MEVRRTPNRDHIMIGVVGRPRISGKSSFVDLISYMRDRDKESIGAEGSVNIDVEKYPAEEMEAVADQNKKCKNPLLHVILSWRETEYPTPEQAHQAVMLTLKEMGLEDCQAVWAVHKDTQNTHLHIAVNRVHPETHKAIDAADGWTIKGVHRAARKVELAQGWEIQQDGIYQVSAEGKLEQKHKDPAKGKYSKSALDMEAHTGEKSAERIAKETAAPIIRAATSWGDLHRGLAEKGIEFVPKGSGAVLKVGDDFVKLSKAGRDITLHKLKDKLGAFEVKHNSVAEREPECIEKIEKRGLKDDWKRYKGQFNKGFKEWLGTNPTPLPTVMYRYHDDCVAYCTTEVLRVEKMDMRGFFADTSARKNCVTYICQDDKKVSFLDYGNKILMGEKYTDESILAMLKLANSKWEVVNVMGTKDYIEACVRVALDHDLKIDNYNINTHKKEQEAEKRKEESEVTAVSSATHQKPRETQELVRSDSPTVETMKPIRASEPTRNVPEAKKPTEPATPSMTVAEAERILKSAAEKIAKPLLEQERKDWERAEKDRAAKLETAKEERKSAVEVIHELDPDYNHPNGGLIKYYFYLESEKKFQKRVQEHKQEVAKERNKQIDRRDKADEAIRDLSRPSYDLTLAEENIRAQAMEIAVKENPGAVAVIKQHKEQQRVLGHDDEGITKANADIYRAINIVPFKKAIEAATAIFAAQGVDEPEVSGVIDGTRYNGVVRETVGEVPDMYVIQQISDIEAVIHRCDDIGMKTKLLSGVELEIISKDGLITSVRTKEEVQVRRWQRQEPQERERSQGQGMQM